MVIFDGRQHDRSRLDQLLAGVEAAARPDAQTRLMASAALGDTAEIVRALEAGARIDSLMGTRRALNLAALNNRPAAIRVLLARGAGINLQNGTGFSAVHHAAEVGAHNALTTLIQAGADLTLRTTRGASPVDIARARNDQTAIRLLEASRKP
jgi:ankyrin repeat protein